MVVVYGNEWVVGVVICESGIVCEEIFVMIKLWVMGLRCGLWVNISCYLGFIYMFWIWLYWFIFDLLIVRWCLWFMVSNGSCLLWWLIKGIGSG